MVSYASGAGPSGFKWRVETNAVEAFGVHAAQNARLGDCPDCRSSLWGDTEGKGATETATPSGAPAFPPNTPGPPANEPVPGEIETAAPKLLAGELEADEGELKLDGSESVQWSDASLGCPQEGMMYA